MYYVINNKKRNDILLKLSAGSFKIYTHPYASIIIDTTLIKDYILTPNVDDDDENTVISQSLLLGLMKGHKSEKIVITLPENKVVKIKSVNANIKLEGRYARLITKSTFGRVQVNADHVMVMSESKISTQIGKIIVHTSDAKMQASKKNTLTINNQKLNLSAFGSKIKRVRSHHD